MRRVRLVLLSLLVLLTAMPLTGCWNYREIDKLGIVAGVAVDKGTLHKYKLTVEIVEISDGREAKPKSKLISTEGDSMFDAVRNGIALLGKRLYWSHAKVIIISRELAESGIVKIIDWYNRDSETRSDVNLLVSGEVTAGEIFTGQTPTESIESFELADMLNNESSLSKAPHVEMWKFINDLEADGIAPIIPRVLLKGEGESKIPHIDGTAVFKQDKLIGFLNGEETKYMLFVNDAVEGGILVVHGEAEEGEIPVSLEIFKNSTKVRPSVRDGVVEVDISTDTIVSVDEIEGSKNYADAGMIKKLEGDIEMLLKNRVEQFIRKMQNEYGADVFGFGAKLHGNNPKSWEKVSHDWERAFRDSKINVAAKVHIRNTAMMTRTIRIGD